MILHDLARSARAGKLHFLAAVASCAVGCAPPESGTLLVNVGQDVSGGSGASSGAGGSEESTSTGGGDVGAGVTSASSSSGGVTPQQATFVVSIDDTSPALDLEDEIDLLVTIEPNGYTGPVSLAINNLGNGGIEGKFASPKVTLDGSTVATVKLRLTTMSSTPPGDVDFSVSGTVATGAKTAPGTLTVKQAITIVIPKGVYQLGGTKADPFKMAFGDYPMNIIAAKDISAQHPLTVRFFNDDDVPHEIHAANQAQGFPHDPGPIAAHSMDGLVRKVNAKGLYDYYLHDQNAAATIGRIAVQ